MADPPDPNRFSVILAQRAMGNSIVAYGGWIFPRNFFYVLFRMHNVSAREFTFSFSPRVHNVHPLSLSLSFFFYPPVTHTHTPRWNGPRSPFIWGIPLFYSLFLLPLEAFVSHSRTSQSPHIFCSYYVHRVKTTRYVTSGDIFMIQLIYLMNGLRFLNILLSVFVA